jgi:hypothetical protein
MEVDERLLVFLPFYKRLLQRDKPWLKPDLSDEVARKAFLRVLEHVGHAKRTTLPDGTERLEPTEEYLRAREQASVKPT